MKKDKIKLEPIPQLSKKKALKKAKAIIKRQKGLMERPEYNIIIPPEIRFDQNLNFTEKVLLCEIAYYGNCWKSDGYFAELYGMDRSGISKCIKQLTEKGFLEKETTYDKEQNAKQRVLRVAKEYWNIFTSVVNNFPSTVNIFTSTGNKVINNSIERNSKSKLVVDFSHFKGILENNPFFNEHSKVKEALLKWLCVLEESEHSKYFKYTEETFKAHLIEFVKRCKYKNNNNKGCFSEEYAIELINTATNGDSTHTDAPYGKLWWSTTPQVPDKYKKNADAPVRLV